VPATAVPTKLVANRSDVAPSWFDTADVTVPATLPATCNRFVPSSVVVPRRRLPVFARDASVDDELLKNIPVLELF
jgi:hypothetical protein